MNSYTVDINIPVTIYLDCKDEQEALIEASKLINRFVRLDINRGFGVRAKINRPKEKN